ncbi:vWA domain-containing protein [uncultured Roseovarius sp.]|uniref:vWA domain-containing protein n=1 Tax=uncultured Roseovarius sp. TaxID=293344 RepID=UPI0026192AA1|nr:vWA domain-containing protein [uncultured Roseovarius sp.]
MRPLIFLAFAISTLVAAPGSAREPQKMDGKDTLYKRVLIREVTNQYDSPDGTAGASLAPLQPLYVYAQDGDWIQVGPDDKGETLFWIEESKSTPWRQNIVATFEGSENLGRVLFFRTEDGVYETVESEDPARVAADFREGALAAENGGAPSDDIVALGPRATPDLRKNLYVMPILKSEEAILESNNAFVNVLKVAVARAGATGNSSGEITENTPLPEVDRENYRAAIVFVVDTTISMEPYIKGTEAALKEVYQSFADKGIEDAVSFGLIGYRDNIEAAPDLGYDVRTFVNLNEGRDAQTFFAGIDQMNEAESTSRNFREDAYMGIDHAVETMDWSEYGARYIVLVTDASPREASDKYSATGLTAAALNSLVKERLQAFTSVLHLKTEKGRKDHAKAEGAYRELVRRSNQDSLYLPVENGDETLYREAARKIGTVATQQVLDFRNGVIPDDEGSRPIPDASSADDGFTAALQSAGRTMQLAYLGRQSGAKAPDVFEAYVADRDFDRPGLKPLSIRLLLTKSQLSDLSEAMRVIFEKGEENILSSDQMFSEVLSAAADMARRPEKVARNADTTLAEAVSISELLDGLPYISDIMKVTEEEWIDMSLSEQQTRLTVLADKIELYSRFNETTDLWVDYLGAGTGADALVYPMKLNDLP